MLGEFFFGSGADADFCIGLVRDIAPNPAAPTS